MYIYVHILYIYICILIYKFINIQNRAKRMRIKKKIPNTLFGPKITRTYATRRIKFLLRKNEKGHMDTKNEERRKTKVL
jgi:hypothetical protein